MHTLDTLLECNQSRSSFSISQRHVDNVNRIIEVIEKSRTNAKIQIGDIVEVTTKYGNYYENAHVDKYYKDDSSWFICDHANPFVDLTEDKQNIICNTSGGEWRFVPKKLKLIGNRLKKFTCWDPGGARADGSLTFQASVNVWEYKEENPMFGEYTTKDWEKHFISYCVDKFGNPMNGSLYRYFGDGIAFVDETEYTAWLKTYKGVEFKGDKDVATVVFCYREKDYLIPKDEWDILDLPKDTRYCNGVNLCKVKYDDDNHIVHVYRYSNSGDLDWQKYRAYELALSSMGRNVKF